MAALPSSLALVTISDGALATAADVRNNFTAIQTEANSLLTTLGAGAAGQVLAGAGTTVTWVYPPGYEITAVELGADTTNSTAGSDTDLVTFPAATFENAKYYADISIPTIRHTVALARLLFKLKEGGTQVGKTLTVQPQTASGDANLRALISFTPSAASHTYKVTWDIVTAGTGTVVATSFDQAIFRIFKA